MSAFLSHVYSYALCVFLMMMNPTTEYRASGCTTGFHPHACPPGWAAAPFKKKKPDRPAFSERGVFLVKKRLPELVCVPCLQVRYDRVSHFPGADELHAFFHDVARAVALLQGLVHCVFDAG